MKIGADGSQIKYFMQTREQAGQAEIQYGHGNVKGAKAVDKVCFIGQTKSKKQHHKQARESGENSGTTNPQGADDDSFANSTN